MSRRVFVSILFLFIAIVPALGQEKLYPIRGNKNVPAILTSDRMAFVVERAFQHKLTLGFPDDDRVAFIPDSGASIVMLWLRVQNTSQRPLDLNVVQFSGTDEEGKMYAALTSAQAADRIISGGPGGSIGTKTLRGISLGRVGSKPPEEQLREDVVRYSLPSTPVAVGGVKEGLIFFEGPSKKKFTFSVRLGDLWSQPLAFSTEKQK
jgi:hypothetical protein